MTEKHARPRRRRRILRITLLLVAVLILGTAGAGWWTYSHLNSNIDSVDLDQAIGDNRPAKVVANAQNILVLGSDSRAGANGDLDHGDVSGARSDTAMLVHIPEGRAKATAVSIPRDTLITRPECKDGDGKTLPSAKRVMFNSVYSLAGPACVVNTVEQLSGVRVDHFVEVDFAGFKGLVDALGGVTVTLDKPMSGAKGGLKLDAGTHRLDGTDSLKFVRTRYGYGDGSDLGRIGLQQQFMLAMLSEIKKQDALGNPARLYKLADAGTKSLTTDSDLGSLTALADFAQSMKGVNPETMETIMLPVAYDKVDPNRVIVAEPQATQLWDAIRKDQPVPASAKNSPAKG
ncbi:LCP family protein [Streptomyces nojiriensis]|uniref:Transcriptional regulator n=1 Tax=Streptomyces nojiriensis TaxID=66374 RepID=A0ABQ3SFJ1_9ACTN|nr:LCP family protein [Streptomyces nojiriensis]QTI48551.1 Cell wall biosynthesis protein LcpA [Streptomyces nojiriensis]GGS03595.1 transcriptional regulator [Streptomyces nojiriensis]GHI66908.1 transcriptional regulator [Streptomyces nojiriensis]